MRQRLNQSAVWTLLSGMILAGAACSQPAGQTARPERTRVVRVARTALERQKLTAPGKFGENGAADVRRRFFDFWNEQIIREDKEVGTVFMGDSITELWNLHVYFNPCLGELIENRGISGDLASVMAKRFEADVIQLRPRNVVILAGTNDVAYLSEKGKSEEEISNDVTASIESMIGGAQGAGVNVLVCSILPTNDDYRKHAEHPALRAQINQRLKALCQTKKCIYVDYAAQMQDAGGALRKDLARDGLHPHWAGYEVMVRVLLQTAKANGLRL